MPSINIDPVLESLIKLTNLRDQHSLELCMAQVLFELVAPREVSLYRINLTDDEPQFVAADARFSSVISQPMREAMLECMRTAERTEVTTSEATALVYPLLGPKKDVIAIIVIESAAEQAHLHHSAGLVLRIYQNFVSLINDNQLDTLTGLLNRKTFELRMGRVLTDIEFYGHRKGEEEVERSSFLAIFDIDHFKRVNDNFGHLVGDEVLLLFSTIMTRMFRADDLLFRFGGEEFVCVIRNINQNVAEDALNRFRESVQNYSFPQVGQVTVSIGFTQINSNDLSSSIIDRADEALYYAKNNGRNQVCSYETLVFQGKLAPRDIAGDIELF